MDEKSKKQSEKALEKNKLAKEARELASEKEAFAISKNIRISPRKVRLIVDQIRGKKVSEAGQILRLTSVGSSPAVYKTVKSAAANAVNNKSLSLEKLYIKKILVNEGKTLKRYQPRAKGSAGSILKRSCHITVVVAEGE